MKPGDISARVYLALLSPDGETIDQLRDIAWPDGPRKSNSIYILLKRLDDILVLHNMKIVRTGRGKKQVYRVMTHDLCQKT